MSHVGSILATPGGVHAVAARDLAGIARRDASRRCCAELAEKPGSTELLVIGTARRWRGCRRR